MDMLHVVYLANWFMGGPPLAVSAWVDKRLEGDGDVEDIALVRYVYPNGQALVNMAWGVGPGGVEIGGTRGRVVMTNTEFGTHPFVPAARLDVVAESGSRSWTPREAVAYGMAGIAGDFRDAVASQWRADRQRRKRTARSGRRAGRLRLGRAGGGGHAAVARRPPGLHERLGRNRRPRSS